MSSDLEEVTRQAELAKLRAELAAAEARAALAKAEAQALLARAEAEAAIAQAEAKTALARAETARALSALPATPVPPSLESPSTASVAPSPPAVAPPQSQAPPVKRPAQPPATVSATPLAPPPPPVWEQAQANPAAQSEETELLTAPDEAPTTIAPPPAAPPTISSAFSINTEPSTANVKSSKSTATKNAAKQRAAEKEPAKEAATEPARAEESSPPAAPVRKRSFFSRKSKNEDKSDVNAKTDPRDKSESPKSSPSEKSRDASAKKGDRQSETNEPSEEDAEAPRHAWGWNAATSRYLAAFSSSMFVHMLLLVLLGMWILPPMFKPTERELVAELDETPEEIVNQVLEETTNAATTVNFTSATAAVASGNLGSLDSPSETKLSAEVTERSDGPKVNVGDVESLGQRGQVMNTSVPMGSFGEPSAVVDNYDQAMDRITQEILLNLAKGKVLVTWCFDQSLSMKDDQKEINARLGRVYQELGLSSAAQGDALWTSVCSYGKGWMMHTEKPTANLEFINAAIDAVPVDDSGMEMMCQAVGHSIAAHRAYATKGQRILMLILVTDESGDEQNNYNYLEPTILEAKADRCAIYVLGREAVFGYPWAHMWWTWQQPAVGGGMVSNRALLRVDRGPESPFVEQLQTAGLMQRQDAHPSGFGPYEQVRMCRETGGVFFMLPSPEINLFQRDNRKYELEIMRPYLPDLRSREQYQEDRDKSIVRSTIWKVINDLNPWKPEIGKYINMRHSFTVDPGAFARQVAAENRKAQEYFLYLDAAEKAMESMQRNRDQEPSPRWQANYDLIYAQIIAYKVRLYEYGAYLEAFVKQPKAVAVPLPNRVQNEWEIAGRTRTITGDLTASYILKSKALFEEIKRYHAGTPWATRAEFELKRGFGVELVPGFYDPTYRPRQPAGGWKVPKI